MPSGAIKQQHGMGAPLDISANPIKVELHSEGIGIGHCQPCPLAFGRTDGAEQIGVLITLICRLPGASTALRPQPYDAIFLAYASLVLKPNFYGLAFGEVANMGVQGSREIYGMARPCIVPHVGRIIQGRSRAMEVVVLGIDLGKNSCSVVGLDQAGRVVLRRRMRRESVIKLGASLPACTMAMEACCGAHHLGRILEAQGHKVRLMSPEYVRPYVKAQKNDDRDAEAIAEAATRPTMRFVELKDEEQLDMQTLHRARDRLVGERTALINQLRAILLERGITAPQGRRKLAIWLDLARSNGELLLGRRVAVLIEDMQAQWSELDRRIQAFDEEFKSYALADAACRLLTSIPGIGPLNATALTASIGEAQLFTRGRDLAAWLGLVPRQMTTGGKPRMLGITKRGNKYLRKMLIHGARAALPTLSSATTPLGAWLRGLLGRAHKNTVVVALAAKLARIVCGVLKSGRPFDHGVTPAAA